MDEKTIAEARERKNLAFKHKEDAYLKYRSACDERQSAIEINSLAWQAYRAAYEKKEAERVNVQNQIEEHDAIWAEYRRIRDRDHSRIEALQHEAAAEQERATKCLDHSIEAYNYGDPEVGRDYSAEAREHRKHYDAITAEIKYLLQEIHDEKVHAETATPPIDKSAYEEAKIEYETAKAAHDSAQVNLRRCTDLCNLYKEGLCSAKRNYIKERDNYRNLIIESKKNN